MATTRQLSRAAYQRLQDELYDLTTRGRIEVAQKIEAARLLGDLSENGDYHAAKDEQGHMEGRIRQLEHILENSEIIEAAEDGVVSPGSIVTILYEGDDASMAERYLVGHMEERSGDLDIVSPESPMGAALIGATEGSWVEYQAPNGTLKVQVVKVESAYVRAAVGGAAPAVTPDLPRGALVDLPGRGATLVRTVDGPPGAATVLLLHGWTATADLNWFACYSGLGEHYQVVALDHRGHGQGIRSRRAFRLEDCADDAIAACDALGIDEVIPVGYSMGGMVAQLMWRRHRDRVAALVLGATGAHFSASRAERLNFLGLSGLAALARLTPPQTRRWLTNQLYLQRKVSTWDPWAIEQASTHDWRMVLEAGRAIGGYDAREWLGDIDVPTAVIVTIRDHVIPVARQIALFRAIPGCEAYRVDGDHDSVVSNPQFLATLTRACASVARAAG